MTKFEVGGGGGPDVLELRASIPAAQSSKVSLIGPFLTSVSSVSGEHFDGISCPMWGMISVMMSGWALLERRNLDLTIESAHTFAKGCSAETASQSLEIQGLLQEQNLL